MYAWARLVQMIYHSPLFDEMISVHAEVEKNTNNAMGNNVRVDE